MQYRRFGKTELSMPVISCGECATSTNGTTFLGERSQREGQENIEKILARALELGINHIETARGYGSSEMQLGFALKHFPRESYILQTKVAPQKDQKEFRKVFDKSMKYLQHDYVELFSLHGINNREIMEYALRPGGCLEEAYKLKEEGRVKHIGFSTHASNTEITEIIERGNFDYVNLHWYLIAQLNGPSIEAAAKKDMGVFIISPNDKGGRLYNPSQKMVDLCDPLEPMAFNDLFCWANPNVHTISCGAARPSDFDTHIKALEHYDDAKNVIAATLDKIYAEVARVGGSSTGMTPGTSVCPNGMRFPVRLMLKTWSASGLGPRPST